MPEPKLFLRNAVVRLGDAVGDLIDRQALRDSECIGAGVGTFHKLLDDPTLQTPLGGNLTFNRRAC